MMPTHTDLSKITLDAYDDGPAVLSVREVDVLVVELGAYQVFAVRGTEWTESLPPVLLNLSTRWRELGEWSTWTNTLDAFRDARVAPWPTQYGYIHKGFWVSTQAWADTYAQWFDLGRPTILTGHSKGAAEATVLALELFQRGHNIVELVNFGEPASLGGNPRRYLDTMPFPKTSYLNRGDWIRHAHTPFCNKTCADRTVLGIEKVPSAHSMALYHQRLSALERARRMHP
jgi:hypothetical protein